MVTTFRKIFSENGVWVQIVFFEKFRFVNPEELDLHQAAEYVRRPRKGKGTRPLFNTKPPADMMEPKKPAKKRPSSELEDPSEEQRIPSPFLDADQEDSGEPILSIRNNRPFLVHVISR